MELTTEFNPVLAELLSFDGLCSIPSPRPLIKGMLHLNSLAWIAGPPGSYKTFMALDYALHVATGTPYMGREATQANVLYVAGEGLSGLSDRVLAWQQAARKPVINTHWLPRAVPVTHTDWAYLCQAAKTVNAGMVILDTQARMAGGLDENDVPAMGRYVEALDQLRIHTGACVVSIHHSSKGGAALRGSSAVQGAADTVITVEARDMHVHVHNLKQKDILTFPEYWVRPVDTGHSCVMIECEKPMDWDVNVRTAYQRKT